MTAYYVLAYQLDHVVRYLVCVTNGTDGVLVDEQRLVPAFGDVKALSGIAGLRKIALLVATLAPPLDLDAVAAWIASPAATPYVPARLFAAWNLFLDVAIAVDDRFLASYRSHELLYRSLSHHSVWSAADAIGEFPENGFGAADAADLARVLEAGLQCFRDNVVPMSGALRAGRTDRRTCARLRPADTGCAAQASPPKNRPHD